jgi:hypothetical protein
MGGTESVNSDTLAGSLVAASSTRTVAHGDTSIVTLLSCPMAGTGTALLTARLPAGSVARAW